MVWGYEPLILVRGPNSIRARSEGLALGSAEFSSCWLRWASAKHAAGEFCFLRPILRIQDPERDPNKVEVPLDQVAALFLVAPASSGVPPFCPFLDVPVLSHQEKASSASFPGPWRSGKKWLGRKLRPCSLMGRGSIFFAILQRRFFSELDQQNDARLKKYGVQLDVERLAESLLDIFPKHTAGFPFALKNWGTVQI